MRQTLSRGMVAAAAATSILSLCGGTALADTAADGVTHDSPGFASGNTVQAPIYVPVNVCGNSVDAVAVLNPAFGNTCANAADAHGGDRHDDGGDRHDDDGGYGDDGGGYGDDGGGYGGDDDGGYGYGDTPPTKPPHTPPTKPPHTTPPPGGHQSTPPPPPGGQEQPPSLPETGAGELLGAAGASAALIVSGVVLYRRGRAATHR
ncbi:chaplin [Streptomyces massasporeus]|uniref:chaplin n=1 Tax=Streptomyces massasporeus TaxID=67324 RepID=UPI003805512B